MMETRHIRVQIFSSLFNIFRAIAAVILNRRRENQSTESFPFVKKEHELIN